MQIKAMTFNTQHCLNFNTQKIDFDVMALAIKECEPDIVVLNEMRGKGVDPNFQSQTEILGARLGYNGFFGYAIMLPSGPYGNAILSRFPIVSAQTVIVPNPVVPANQFVRYETRAFISARVLLPDGRELTVLGTHFGLEGGQKENSITVFQKLYTPNLCVFMGDLNVKPDNPILNPIRKLMQDAGDMLPQNACCTFPSDAPKEKIDYIFCSQDMNIVSAEIPNIVASDHRPHTAIIDC